MLDMDDIADVTAACTAGGPYRIHTTTPDGIREQWIAWVEPQKWGEPKGSLFPMVRDHLAKTSNVSKRSLLKPSVVAGLLLERLAALPRYPRPMLTATALVAPFHTRVLFVTRKQAEFKVVHTEGGQGVRAGEQNRWSLLNALVANPASHQLCLDLPMEEVERHFQQFYERLDKEPTRTCPTLYVQSLELTNYVEAVIRTHESRTTTDDTKNLKNAFVGISKFTTTFFHDFTDNKLRRGTLVEMIRHVNEGTVHDDVYVWIPREDIMIYISHHDFFRLLRMA
jgi:hypothetical protein